MSYRAKINEQKLSTESGKIAFAIDLLERMHELRNERWDAELGNDTPLYDGIVIRGSGFVWEVWKPVECKPNRYYVKYVQQWLTYDGAKKMLDAQPWQYI